MVNRSTFLPELTSLLLPLCQATRCARRSVILEKSETFLHIVLKHATARFFPARCSIKNKAVVKVLRVCPCFLQSDRLPDRRLRGRRARSEAHKNPKAK
ncbi:hypothetical protein DENSPDRAFT_839828 [Dentipellis sp. KUC8613]|nr:hypothetical protein DENSPDRAFT_839828 [Dentipellis sp. KUC8613]